MDCVHCSKKVEGKFENVYLTLCCADCCRLTRATYSRVYRGRYRVSKTRAISDYGCTHDDLVTLNCETLPNPVDKNGRPMKLYLRAEVEYLGSLRKKAREAEAAERELGAVIGKLKGLEESLGTNLSEMDSVLRHFLLGDFLNKKSETEMTWEDVHERYAVIDRVKEILHRCHGAHPSAVFNFCLEHPTASPTEFQDLKEKLRLVFRLEGARILYNVPQDELVNLLHTPLKDDCEEFFNRDPIAVIRGHLLKWFSEEVVQQIMSYPGCLRRIEYGGEEEGLAKKLMIFWKEKDDKQKRRKQLVTMLESNGVAVPVNCSFCTQYINGEIDCDLEEVLGIVRINAWCDEHQYIRQGIVGEVARSRFKQCFFERKMDFDKAYEAAMDAARAVECASPFDLFFPDYSSPYSDYSVDEWGYDIYLDETEEQNVEELYSDDFSLENEDIYVLW